MTKMNWQGAVLSLLLCVLGTAALPHEKIFTFNGTEATGCSQIKDGFVDCSHRGLREVPKDIPKSVRILDLSHNSIYTIPSDAFDGLKNLKILRLDHNSISRKSIVRDLFKDLSGLQELYLNHNEVNKFQENVFTYLGNLQVLDLSDMNNGIPKPIQAAVFSPLKSLVDLRLNNVLLRSFNFVEAGVVLKQLRRLALARNDVDTVGKNDFSYLQGAVIDELDLSSNSLRSIDPSCFAGIEFLKSLNLNRALSDVSVISQVGSSVQNVHITNLTLVSIGLESLSATTFETFATSTLKNLDLSLNNISSIKDAPFRYFKQLTQLNLYKNNISYIGPGAFEHLANLVTLDLSNNSLTTLNETTFVSLNGSALDTMYLELNLIDSIEEGAFHTLGNLRYLKLSKNRISQYFKGPEFDGMAKLEFLDLGLNTEITLDSDAFESVKNLKKLYLNVIGMKKMESGKSPFRHLTKLQTLDLSNNSMSVIVAPDIFKPLANLEVLYVQHNNLYHIWEDTKIPTAFLDGLTSLQKADLSYNGFSFIPNGTFQSLKRLKTLLLAHNKLSTIPPSSFAGLTSLVKLELHYNRMNVINKSSFSPFLTTLESVSISNNPFLCNCELEWFRKWINDTQVNIPDLGKTQCADPPGKLLLDFWPSPYDCDGVLRPYYYVIIVGVPLLIIFIIFILWCCRWRIRYWLLRGKARRRTRRRGGYHEITGRNEEHHYDVFISYSSKDGDWVKNVLKPELENPEEGHERFEINDHDESFVAGETIVENIIEAVDQSRKTLCILSKNYLQSNWCRYEQEVAMFKHLGDKKCLVVIRLDDVKDQELKQHDHIHQVMRQDTYLAWPGNDASEVKQKWFWEKLREAVAKEENERCSWCCCCCCCCC